jgi:hypothetical protein
MTSCPLSRPSLPTTLHKETSNIHWKDVCKDLLAERKREGRKERERKEEKVREGERKLHALSYEELIGSHME